MDPSQPSIDIDPDDMRAMLRTRNAAWPVAAEDDTTDFDGFASEALDED